jgi:hypothetical protein
MSVTSIKALAFGQEVWADIIIVSKQYARCLESFGNQRGDNTRIGTVFDNQPYSDHTQYL